jgi:hypothetical protein
MANVRISINLTEDEFKRVNQAKKIKGVKSFKELLLL